jgi:hypothetical protein
LALKKKRINICLSRDVFSNSENFLKKQNRVKTLTVLIEKSLKYFMSRKARRPLNRKNQRHDGAIRLTKELLGRYRSLGIIDENGVRNVWIKQEFKRRQFSGVKRKKYDIITELARQLFMDPSTIEDIIYRKKGRKKHFLSFIEEI